MATRAENPRTNHRDGPNVTKLAEEIDALRRHYDDLIAQARDSGPAAIAQLSVAMRYDVEKVEESFEALSKTLTRVKQDVLPKVFEAGATKSISVEDPLGLPFLWSVSATETVRASLNGERRSEGFEWLRKVGLGGLIQETVHAGSLSSAISERLETGAAVPDDLVNVHVQANTSMTKRKKSK